MTQSLYRNLSWLPAAPEDFSSECRAIIDEPSDAGVRLRQLADHALTDRQLAQLATSVSGAHTLRIDLNPLVPFRLGILSSSTADFSSSAIVGSSLRHGMALECVMAEYGSVVQEALSAKSEFRSGNLDAVLIALDYRSLPLRTELGNRSSAETCVHTSLQYFETVRAAVRRSGVPVCIVETLVPPAERLFGSLDRRLSGSLLTTIDSINRGIKESIAEAATFFSTSLALRKSLALPIGTPQRPGTLRSCLFPIPIFLSMPITSLDSSLPCAAKAEESSCLTSTTQSGEA